MTTYCPRSKCAWTGPDGKCHWPTDHCPCQVERQAAEQVQQQQKLAEQQARQKRRLGLAVTPPGVYERRDGRFRALIQAGRNGKLYVLGTYDTVQEAAAVRHLAEQHRKNGDLDEWAQSRNQSTNRGG